MALTKPGLYLPLVAFSLAAPSLCLAGAISINGTCELGNCTTPDTLKYNTVTGQAFSYVYTFPNTDQYRIFGFYSASTSANGTKIKSNVHARYIGNSTNTESGADLLTVDVLQDYHYPFSLDGTYSYSQDLRIGSYPAAGSYVETNLYYDGQDVGLIGPLVGQGTYSGSASADLTGLARPLSADYRYTFFFAEGSVPIPGANDSEHMGATGSGGSELLGENHER